MIDSAASGEFEAFLECGILAQGFLRLRCAAGGYNKLLTRRGVLVEEDEGRSRYMADADAPAEHLWRCPAMRLYARVKVGRRVLD